MLSTVHHHLFLIIYIDAQSVDALARLLCLPNLTILKHILANFLKMFQTFSVSIPNQGKTIRQGTEAMTEAITRASKMAFIIDALAAVFMITALKAFLVFSSYILDVGVACVALFSAPRTKVWLSSLSTFSNSRLEISQLLAQFLSSAY